MFVCLHAYGRVCVGVCMYLCMSLCMAVGVGVLGSFNFLLVILSSVSPVVCFFVFCFFFNLCKAL